MKKIYLIRHGKAGYDANVTSDKGRTLNEEGLIDVGILGKLLAKSYNHPNLIIYSPAERTKQTALIINENFNTKTISFPKLYNAEIEQVLDVLNETPPEVKIVYLVGHNPSLSLITGYLTGKYVNLSPANVSVITFDNDEWSILSKDTCHLEEIIAV